MTTINATCVRSFSIHPVFLVILQATTVLLIIGLISANSYARLLVLPWIFSVPWYVVPRCHEQLQGAMWSGIIGSASASCSLTYVDLAFLSKWSFEVHGPIKSTHGQRFAKSPPRESKQVTEGQLCERSSLVDRLHFGFSSAFNGRMIGTPSQVRGVPPFSSKDDRYIRTRPEFVFQNCSRFLKSYLVLDILTAWGDPTKNRVIYSLDLVPIFRHLQEVTFEEIAIRLTTTIAYWTIIYCVMTMLYSIVSLTAVLSGISEVRSWPPLYGPLSQAYTIRGFWGLVLRKAGMASEEHVADALEQVILAPTQSTKVFFSSILVHLFRPTFQERRILRSIHILLSRVLHVRSYTCVDGRICGNAMETIRFSPLLHNPILWCVLGRHVPAVLVEHGGKYTGEIHEARRICMGASLPCLVCAWLGIPLAGR